MCGRNGQQLPLWYELVGLAQPLSHQYHSHLGVTASAVQRKRPLSGSVTHEITNILLGIHLSDNPSLK